MNIPPDLTTTTLSQERKVIMASIQPKKTINATASSSEAQKPYWDAEDTLYQLECEIDTLDKISDGLPDDPITTNALNSLHAKLSNIYAKFKTELLD